MANFITIDCNAKPSKTAMLELIEDIRKKADERGTLWDKVTNKTMIVKDSDTMLESPELSRILAESRRLYDGDFCRRVDTPVIVNTKESTNG